MATHNKVPYSVKKVKELAPKIEKFLEENCKGRYTYPEIIVAMHQAIYTAIFWQAEKNLS